MANFEIKDKAITNLTTGVRFLVGTDPVLGTSTTQTISWSQISGALLIPQIFYGSGNPNGVVTATPPAIYYDRNVNSLTYLTTWFNTGISTNNNFWV